MDTCISHSVGETVAAGQRFAASARPGDVVGLVGDLGAGKTHFVKGLVAGLQSSAVVTSPTFAMVHEYEDGPMPVYHFDFYRLESAEAGSRLGFEDYFDGDGLSVIEWADRFPELLPPRSRWVQFEIGSETERTIRENWRP